MLTKRKLIVDNSKRLLGIININGAQPHLPRYFSTNNNIGQEAQPEMLKFIKLNQQFNLKQIYKRQAGKYDDSFIIYLIMTLTQICFVECIDDNLFPKYKDRSDDFTKDEILELISKKNFEVIKEIVDKVQSQEQIELYAQLLYDQDFDCIKMLYDKAIELQEAGASKVISDKTYNCLAWGAAHFNEFKFLTMLIYQASILNVNIDI